MKAWHFVGATLRDGRQLPADGEKLIHEGRLELCRSGLHASVDILDALQYAPGNTICRVECGGGILHESDKLVCRERTILWRVDGEQLLRKFARMCALDVVPLWDAPGVVVRYLETGDERMRAAAWDAAEAAAGQAAKAAAWDAAEAAAGQAAKAAAWKAAAWAAAEAAAWDAAWDAAGAAAWDAAKAAAWDAAWEAARATQARRLLRMVHEAQP